MEQQATALQNAPGASTGVRALFVGQVLRVVIFLFSVTVLSRLLTPSDFGEAAIVISVVSIVGSFGDVGLSIAAIRERDLTRAQWSSLFWIGAVIGLFLTTLFAASSHWISELLSAPGAYRLVWMASPVFLLEGVTGQYKVQLIRMGRFSRLAIAEVMAPLLALVIQIILAIFWPGAYVLVLQRTFAAFILLVIAVGSVRMVPMPPRRGAGIRNIVKLGGVASINNILFTVVGSLPSLSLSGLQPEAVIGSYSRAQSLATIPHTNLGASLTRSVVPSLSKAHSSGGINETFKYICIAYGYIIGLTVGLMGGLSRSVTSIALGAQWLEITPNLLSILSITYILYILYYVSYWVLLATGQSKVLVICDTPGYIFAIIGILVFARIGAIAVAWVTVVGVLISAIIYLFYGLPKAGILPTTAIQASMLPFSLSIYTFIIGLLVDRWAILDSAILRIVAAFIIVSVTLLLLFKVSKRVRADLKIVVSLALSQLKGLMPASRMEPIMAKVQSW